MTDIQIAKGALCRARRWESNHQHEECRAHNISDSPHRFIPQLT
jgi:hypothetical protein